MTSYSFTEKKRIRKDFAKSRAILEVPFLLAIQVDSYREFLQENVDPAKRINVTGHKMPPNLAPETQAALQIDQSSGAQRGKVRQPPRFLEDVKPQ